MIDALLRGRDRPCPFCGSRAVVLLPDREYPASIGPALTALRGCESCGRAFEPPAPRSACAGLIALGVAVLALAAAELVSVDSGGSWSWRRLGSVAGVTCFAAWLVLVGVRGLRRRGARSVDTGEDRPSEAPGSAHAPGEGLGSEHSPGEGRPNGGRDAR